MATPLKPPPRNLKELQAECMKRGMMKKDADFSSKNKRNQLLAHMWNSHNMGRSIDRASILLVGSSGVGKSSTINHLFDLKEKQTVCFAKTSDASSETRTTTEFLLEVNSPHLFETSGLKLGLVDTPGFNDTDGSKQDACNFYSIKKFYEKHMNGSRPNLVFVLIQATDTRIQGKNSNLAKSLRCLKALKLIDTKKPNVVAILTWSTSLGESKNKFNRNVTRKMQIVKETIFQFLEVNAPVVALENDIEDLNRDGDYTILPDGTRQVKNLYTACLNVFKANGDSYGQLIFNEAFSSGPKKLSVGGQVHAKNANTDRLSKDEDHFFQFFSRALEGGISDPLVQEAQKFINEEIGEDDTNKAGEIQSLVGVLKNNGVEDLLDLKYLSMKGVNLKTDEEISPVGEQFLKRIGIKDTIASIAQDSAGVIAQGYNLLNDTVVPSKIFVCQETVSKYGLAIPSIANIVAVNETKTFMNQYDSETALITDRLSHLNVSLDVDYKAFSFSSKAGFSLASNYQSSINSHEMSFYVEERIFEVNMGNFRDKNIILTEDFKHDVSLIPGSFDIQDAENRKKFERFFNRWGHFVVSKVTGGGSIEMKINSSAIKSESQDIGMIRASLAASFSCGFLDVDASVDMGHDSMIGINTKTILASSTIAWNGGARELHKKETIQDPHLMDSWRNSLTTRPTMLTTDMYLEPISTMVQLADPKKYDATYDALKDFLGGSFKVVANKQKEAKDLAEKNRLEAEEAERQKQKNEANKRDATIETPPTPKKKCFPPESTVTVQRNGVEIKEKLAKLMIGDTVQCYDMKKNEIVFSPLIVWVDIDQTSTVSYLHIGLEDGSSIKISDEHLIMVGSSHKTKLARDVKLGETLLSLAGGDTKVTSITQVEEVGLLAPVTAAGNLFVDGVLASCYANLDPDGWNILGKNISAQTIGKIGFFPLRVSRMLFKKKTTAWKDMTCGLHPYAHFLMRVHESLLMKKLMGGI